LRERKKKKKKKEREEDSPSESSGNKSEIYSGLIYDRAARRIARADSPLAKRKKERKKEEVKEGIINGVENGAAFSGCSRDFEEG